MNKWLCESPKELRELVQSPRSRLPLQTTSYDPHLVQPYLCPSNVTSQFIFNVNSVLQLIYDQCFWQHRIIWHLGPYLGKKSQGKVQWQAGGWHSCSFTKCFQFFSLFPLVGKYGHVTASASEIPLLGGSFKGQDEIHHALCPSVQVTRNVPMNQHGSHSKSNIKQMCNGYGKAQNKPLFL